MAPAILSMIWIIHHALTGFIIQIQDGGVTMILTSMADGMAIMACL